MKQLILLICFIALMNPVFSNENIKDSITIGYCVVIKKCDSIHRLETGPIAEVYAFIHVAYPDFCADLNYILEKSPYYRENCFEREIYVEKMRINKKWKYKRFKYKKQNIYL